MAKDRAAPTRSGSEPGERLALAGLVALCLLLFFFGLGTRDLWDQDEGMHAAISKAMVQGGDWVTPRFNGEPFFDKPILFTWLVSASFALFGFGEVAARLPAAALGLGCVLVTWFLGRQMLGPRAGFVGGLMLAASPGFLAFARSVVHDIALVLFTALALSLFWVATTDERRRGRCFLLFHVALALAFLTKGPVGLLLPALVIAPWIVLTGRWPLLREMRLGWGALIVLAVGMPWYVLMEARNPGYLAYFLVDKNFGHFAQGSRHLRPVTYYVPMLLGGMLPWSAFLPAALYRGFRDWRRRRRAETLFLGLWVVMMFLFFSAAESKLPAYILPLYPGAALLAALFWSDLMARSEEGLRKVAAWSLAPFAVLLTAALAGAAGVPMMGPMQARYGTTPAEFFAVGGVMAGGVVAGLALLVAGRYRASLGSMTGMMAAVVLLFSLQLGPTMNPYRSTRELAMELDGRLPPDEKIACFRRLKHSALFYTGRLGLALETPEEVEAFLANPLPVFCIVDLRHRDRLEELEGRFAVIAERGNKIVISNRPGEAWPTVDGGSAPQQLSARDQ